MSDITVEDFLEHYGKKGMKWGRRKVRTSSDYKKTAHLRNRKTSELSNKQLQSVNNRINLEANYRRLNPGKLAVGHQMVKSMLAGAGTAVSIYALVNSPAGKAAINLGKQALAKKV